MSEPTTNIQIYVADRARLARIQADRMVAGEPTELAKVMRWLLDVRDEYARLVQAGHGVGS